MQERISAEKFAKTVKKKHKYYAKATKYNGVVYHSSKEAHRAAQLDLLQKQGEIASWKRQVAFNLSVNKIKIGKYIADFEVCYPDRTVIYEDTKGFATSLWKWKIKHFMAEYPYIKIRIL